MKKNVTILFVLVLVSAAVFQAFTSKPKTELTQNNNATLKKEVLVAPRPPMGWNSFDAYDCRINEAEYRQTVEFMDKNLKKFGWDYAVIDYVWFNHSPGNWNNPKRRYGHPDIRMTADGKPLDKLVMDEYGRLMPSEIRFPSAAGGTGFKALADWVHSKGLKFGIHIMRGIPRQAYFENLPIKGTKYHAKDIAEPWDTCNWQNNLYGVDPTKPGAQEYYNSLFELYAAWGVDFIKADDMMYPMYHKGEIEMMHKAIENSGRPMVLSLSCGEAPIAQAEHLIKNANMWRISADFWDNWESLRRNFDLMNAWAPFTRENHWPDADMLPIGKLALQNRPKGKERLSEFTHDEHYTLMTLWCMARSPLMMGGDLLSTPQETIKTFLQNEEVLSINQSSIDNRQILEFRNSVVWIATDPKTGDRFVALFNIGEKTQRVEFDMEHEYMRDNYHVRDLWARKDLGVAKRKISADIPAHGARLYRLSKTSEKVTLN